MSLASQLAVDRHCWLAGTIGGGSYDWVGFLRGFRLDQYMIYVDVMCMATKGSALLIQSCHFSGQASRHPDIACSLLCGRAGFLCVEAMLARTRGSATGSDACCQSFVCILEARCHSAASPKRPGNPLRPVQKSRYSRFPLRGRTVVVSSWAGRAIIHCWFGLNGN